MFFDSFIIAVLFVILDHLQHLADVDLLQHVSSKLTTS